MKKVQVVYWNNELIQLTCSLHGKKNMATVQLPGTLQLKSVQWSEFTWINSEYRYLNYTMHSVLSFITDISVGSIVRMMVIVIRKSNWQSKINSFTKLFVFWFSLMLLGKVRIHLFTYTQLCINSWDKWVL